MGIHLLTPEYKNLRTNVKANLNWLNQAKEQGNQAWTEFLNNQAGINYQRCITSRINLYLSFNFQSWSDNLHFMVGKYF